MRSYRPSYVAFALFAAWILPTTAYGDLPIVLGDQEWQVDVSGHQYFDLGNVTNSGDRGLAFRVEPSESVRQDRQWLPEWNFYTWDEPVPNSPAQGAIELVSGESLTAVIPQFAHLPFQAVLDHSFHIEGNELFIDATMEHGMAVTATIYGPHEYLLPIGELAAGDYRLNLRLTHVYSWEQYPQTQTTTRFIEFTVLPGHSDVVVPEPPALAMLAIAGTCLTVLSRLRRVCRA